MSQKLDNIAVQYTINFPLKHFWRQITTHDSQVILKASTAVTVFGKEVGLITKQLSQSTSFSGFHDETQRLNTAEKEAGETPRFNLQIVKPITTSHLQVVMEPFGV